MKKKNRNIFEIKRGILKCKKRLDALKNQGFIFSQDIYDNLDLLERKKNNRIIADPPNLE